MAQKVEGFKLTPVSIAELAGAVILALMTIPLASSAYYNYIAGSNYDIAVDKYLSGEYVAAAKHLKKTIDARPELYYPREMLGMTLYYQNEPGSAEAAYNELGKKLSELSSGQERKVLIDAAVESLKLIQARKNAVRLDDETYAGPAEELRDLAGKKSQFLEPKILAIQVELDKLSGEKITDRERRQLVDAVLADLEDYEESAWKSAKLSPWGAAILYNSLGICYARIAMDDYDRLQAINLSGREKEQKYGEVGQISAQAVFYFRRSLQYRLDWTAPWINFERAMAFKLVEEGLNDAPRDEYDKVPVEPREERMKYRWFWIDYTTAFNAKVAKPDYLTERNNYTDYLRYRRGKNLEKQFNLEPAKNDYALQNALGWAYSRVRDHGNASSKLRSALRLNGTNGIADYNLARTRARFWKEYEGLIEVTRDETVTSRQEAWDFYRDALKNSGTTKDVLRRVRLRNNYGVFLYKGLKQLIPAAKELEAAHSDMTKAVETDPRLAREAARQNLGATVNANLKSIYQAVLDSDLKPDIKDAYKDKLDELIR